MQLKIPLIFAGTASIGCPLLEALHQDGRFEIRTVITSVDRPAGRKMKLTPSPIKEKAIKLGLPVFQPQDINAEESMAKIKMLQPLLIVVIAYGQLFKKELLQLPPFGCINVHGSLLPKYRGASPIQQALLNQDSETGISIMRMEEGMDSGPVFARFKIPIEKSDDSTSLFDKLAELSAQKTPDALEQIISHQVKPISQNEAEASYCQKIQKTDGEINWNEPADQIVAKIKAFAGWPGSYTFWEGKRLKIIKAGQANNDGPEPAGMVVQKGGHILVRCQKGAIQLKEVQLEGKSSQPIEVFVKGYSDFIGSELKNQLFGINS